MTIAQFSQKEFKIQDKPVLRAEDMKQSRFREIPYNYTSFSDREIVLKYFDEETWHILGQLRSQRITGKSARLLFDIYGDIFIIDRNPYIYNDLVENKRKRRKLLRNHRLKFQVIEKAAGDNDLVTALLKKTRTAHRKFFDRLIMERRKRRKVLSLLSRVTSRNNIHYTAFHTVSHCTDATDWRVEQPFLVVYPDNAGEVRSLIGAARRTGLKIIPRGGGTGLTGGAIPVHHDTMIINMEKLDGIGPIEPVPAGEKEIPVITVEGGAVTERVIEYCSHRGFIFATDPTSAWASTIGGNIAENAGGKKCVMWGTAIDNVFSYRLVDHHGDIIEVVRRNHPHRKILPDDLVIFDVYALDDNGEQDDLIHSISLQGTDIRKKGLGKDITNKVLGGLPGLQKEGGDGIITSARFVLYQPFLHCRTICLEFYGSNMINASRAILEIKNRSEGETGVFLTALEHFDEKYVRAIGYANKSKRNEIPKAVLLIDVESNDPSSLEASCSAIQQLVGAYNTESFIATDEKSRERFWKDRKNLGAIARHTNAFKLNEDIVIPIERLPEFADFIERMNMRKELENCMSVMDAVESLLTEKEGTEKDEFLQSRINRYLQALRGLRITMKGYATNLETPCSKYFKYQSEYSNHRGTLFEIIRDGKITIPYEIEVLQSFRDTFNGHRDLMESFEKSVIVEHSRRIIIATHMHAGDGNVHVNIPVHSNDYLMMREADETAEIIMKKAVSLGGVISGEHGIGLTKLKFLDQSILREYEIYKLKNDPDDLFNPGKLRADFPLSRIYTPSFNLMEIEALILEATDLESLSTSIASCVRCGKCKSVCNTHYPGGTMMYNPRNKILGVALIIEAVLYDIQTSKTLSFRNFRKLIEISDHCTVCHNCEKPCPVNIDFGQISLLIRRILVQRKKKKSKILTAMTLIYLRKRGYLVNKAFRIALLKWGYRAQRIGYYLNSPLSALTMKISPFVGYMLQSRLPKSGKKSLWETLHIRGNFFLSIENGDMPVKQSVFYFPGCGSERMFPEISLAALALLYYAGIRIVIPPRYLCCGYPFRANGKSDAEIKSYENRVILNRISDFVSYMNIGHIVVSCGTCYEMLKESNVEGIFANSSLIDVNEYIALEGLYCPFEIKEKILFHDPCHSPLKNLGPSGVISRLFNTGIDAVENCCGEGGTLALSTPEISSRLRDRKTKNIINATGPGKCRILTACPSCVQGLSRIDRPVRVSGQSLIVFCADTFLGNNWQRRFIRDLRKGGFEQILY